MSGQTVMRKLIIVVTSICITGAACWLTISKLHSQLSGELLSVEPSRQSFAVRPNERVKASFVLGNLTRDPIKVLGFNSSCGCTVAAGIPVEIPPSQSATVFVLLEVGDERPGNEISQSVELLLNVPSPVVRLTVAGSVVN